jgi:hypothetical protein
MVLNFPNDEVMTTYVIEWFHNIKNIFFLKTPQSLYTKCKYPMGLGVVRTQIARMFLVFVSMSGTIR